MAIQRVEFANIKVSGDLLAGTHLRIEADGKVIPATAAAIELVAGNLSELVLRIPLRRCEVDVHGISAKRQQAQDGGLSP